MAESFASISRYGASRTQYDVFLNFCASTKFFAGHLGESLYRGGIRTCGGYWNFGLVALSPAHIEAIRESKMSIIIFSNNYAFSERCLDELVEILECRKSFGQLVWPVFLGVTPSEVRNRTGNFRKALAEYEGISERKKEKLAKWKDALTQASSLSGWCLHYGAEFLLIRRIVGAALREVGCSVPPNFVEYSVGIEDRLLELETLIDVGTGKNDVKIVGIYGIGGVGKSTIAKALFDTFADEFEGSSFLENVRETSKQNLGLIQLLDELGNKHVMVVDTPRGIDIVRERLCSKRVLVVLDDVDELDQQEALERGHGWFGLGSRIIITTRNEHLLTAHRADHGIYEVRELDHRSAVELFSWHAFCGDEPLEEEYRTLSDHIVRYVGGLPLALEALGSFLHDKEKHCWEDVIAYLEKKPDRKLYQILKLIFDTLGDFERALFQCIACFFVGEDTYYVAGKMKAFEYGWSRMDEFINLSLIQVDDKRLRMHNLIETIGKEIFCQESFEAYKHGRLWRPYDIFCSFLENIDANIKDDQSIAWRGGIDDMKNKHKKVFDRLQPPTDVQDDSNATENTQEEVFQDFQDANLKDGQFVACRGDTDVIKNINDKISDNGPKPLTKLQQQHVVFWIQIQLYKAKIFSNWGGHGSFSHLVEVDVGYCKSCYCLPPLGQLPFLKKLRIQGFDRVEKVGEEFYSTTDFLSSSKPFKSLESLTFSHMFRWKEWSFMESGVFLDLKQLTLDNCRKLDGTCFPTYLPSLQSLLNIGMQKTSGGITLN